MAGHDFTPTLAVKRGPALTTALRDLHPFDILALASFAALALLILFTFRDYAISNDEEVQHRYGQLIVAYYASGLRDQTLFHLGNLYLYGGLFDIVAALLERVLPFSFADIRHLLCALIGLGGIAATWAVARMVAGPRAGAFAVLGLAVCGPWYGGMFNHTKDVPLAAAMMGATYFLLRAARDLPRPRLRHVMLFGLLLGAALGLRATALLMLGYVGLAAAMRCLEARNWPERAYFLGQSFVAFLPGFVLAYIVMIAAWPWAFLAPLNPLRAIFAFAHFQYSINTLAFGHIYAMAEVPRWYVPLYLAIKLPLLVLLGSVLALTNAGRSAARRGLSHDRTREVILLAFMVGFPVLCHVLARGPAFTGMRHFLLVVPPLAALAAIGFDNVVGLLERRGRAFATIAWMLLAAAWSWNASIQVRLHPHQYVFYNGLVGGLEGAVRRFDTDYWVNIMPEAVQRLEAFLRQTEGDASTAARKYQVGICAERISFENEVTDPRLVWTDDWPQADFFIAPTHMNCDRVLLGDTIATIERLGATLGVIKDRRRTPVRGVQ